DILTLQYDEKVILGTVDYVAPEQVRDSHGVDIRADVYSLGATLYFLLSGHPPFPHGKKAQKLVLHQTTNPTPIRQLRPDVPAELAEVLERMMAKDPALRPQTPDEVCVALAPWASQPVAPPSEQELPPRNLGLIRAINPPPGRLPAPRES